MARTSKKKQEIVKQPGRIYSVGIYARLSVDSGDRKNESIETQVEIAEAFVGKQADMAVYGTYTDIGRTGTNFEREGFERMMRDVRARKIDCIVVKDLSRFGRNHIETGNYIEKIFPFMGVRFVAVTDNFDSMDFSGKNEVMTMNLKNLVNEMYARDIAVKVKASKRAKWEQGSYTGGIPPYGYRAEWIDGKKCLFVEETTAAVVKKIYELFLSENNMQEIIAWLYENRVVRPTEYHKTGQVYCREDNELRQWSRRTIRTILTNPVYMGYLVQGCTCGKDYRKREKHNVFPGDWSVKEGTHEAIISEEMFLEAAGKFETAAACSDKDSEAIPSEEDLFTGVIYCGECGTKMRRVAVIKEFSSKNKVRTYRYKCPRSGRIDQLRCEGKSIGMKALTKIIKEAVRQEFILYGICPKELVDRNNREAENLKAEWNGQLAAIEKKLEGIAKAGSEQYLKYRMKEMDADGFKRAKDENDKKADSLRAKEHVIVEKIRKIDSETEKKNHFLRTLPKGGDKGDLTTEIVRTLFERIEIYPEHRVKVVFAFQKSEILSGKGGV